MQMMTNKAAGLANWFHPASLTTGVRFAHGSAAMTAVQSARGMLAAAWHMATGGRQAECFRWRWTDTGLDGLSEESVPPVWSLGLAGVFQQFQEAEGTGFFMTNWHCKHGYSYGDPDCIPLLPASMSGLCLGAITNLAFHVLMFLQPASPSNPIVQDIKWQPSAPQTLNNARGDVFPYGQLKHLPAMLGSSSSPASDQDMPRIVNTAISSASFVDRC